MTNVFANVTGTVVEAAKAAAIKVSGYAGTAWTWTKDIVTKYPMILNVAGAVVSGAMFTSDVHTAATVAATTAGVWESIQADFNQGSFWMAMFKILLAMIAAALATYLVAYLPLWVLLAGYEVTMFLVDMLVYPALAVLA